ncbi:cytochrome P450 [Nocardioides zeae]|uniref:Cytochrome P450 n=1 Tax=Nocardioides imazamoxiresistens TaxID=3231893 RepID=A0ABU3PSC9_9ACTN|nr:cytochrome P450 [Nocardioides zeae]MDT9592145.1 cytochrome P450 [Nocardioides zeae]
MPTMLERAESHGLPVHLLDLENDERLAADPFGVWDEMTKVAPLFYSPANRGFLVASDFDTIKTVLRDAKTWANLPTTIVYTKEQVLMNTPPISMDPPVHTKFRRALIPLFAPNEVTPLEPRIHEITHRLIDEMLTKPDPDYIRDFSSQLPARFFLGWLGLGDDDVSRMYQLAQRATFEFEDQAKRDAVEHEIGEIVGNLFRARKEHPQDDLASKMLAMEIDGEPIDVDLCIDIGRLAFIAGQDTTSTQLGYIMWHLARNPQDRAHMVARPELTNDAVEELTRYYNTGGPAGRIARQAGELNGYPIEPGDRVFIARCGADRQFAPEVQLDRKPNRHTAFGLGIHRCLGSHVARVEMEIALKVWHERIPEYRIADGFAPRHRYGSFMQQLTSLPLALG